MLRKIPWLILVLALFYLPFVTSAQAMPSQSAPQVANTAVITISPQSFEEGQYDVIFDSYLVGSENDWTTYTEQPSAQTIEEGQYDVIFDNDVASSSNLQTTYTLTSMPAMFANGQNGAIYDTNGVPALSESNYVANYPMNLRTGVVLVVILPTYVSGSINTFDETMCGVQLAC